jgi:predicted ArsR family transcriptional regulator
MTPEPEQTESEYVNAAQALHILRISPQHFYRLVNQGNLQSHIRPGKSRGRPGRFYLRADIVQLREQLRPRQNYEPLIPAARESKPIAPVTTLMGGMRQSIKRARRDVGEMRSEVQGMVEKLSTIDETLASLQDRLR